MTDQNQIVFGEWECCECGRPVSTVSDNRGVHFIHAEDAYDMQEPDELGNIYGSDVAHERGKKRNCIQARVCYREIYPRNQTERWLVTAWQFHEEHQPIPVPRPGETVKE